MTDPTPAGDQTTALGITGFVLGVFGLAAAVIVWDWRWAATGVLALVLLAPLGPALATRTSSAAAGAALAGFTSAGGLAATWTGQWRWLVLGAATAIASAIVAGAHERRAR